MRLWRIAAATRTYRADDLGGVGAALAPGRWNDVGEHVVYCAASISLAVLETCAHVDPAGLPMNRFLVAIDVPEALWQSAARRVVTELDRTWCAIPASQASVAVGSAWYLGGRELLLRVPSVIVPEEDVVLVNARHADARRLSATIVRPHEYDRLFRNGTRVT
jgi:RES domain-containing protein